MSDNYKIEESVLEYENKLQFLHSVIDGVQDPVIAIGLDLKILTLNKAAKKVFAGDIVLDSKNAILPEITCHQLIYGSDKPCGGDDRPCPMYRVNQTGKPYTTVHTLKKETRLPRRMEMMGAPMFGASGEIIGMVEVLHDNSVLFDAMDRVRENEERLNTVMCGVVDGIVMTNIEGRIESCNPSMERMFGYEVGELTDLSIGVLMSEPERGAHLTHMQRYLETGEAAAIGKVGREFSVIRKDGTKFQATIELGEAGEGDNRRFVAIIRDWTEQKRVLRELEEAREKYLHREKMATIGQLTAGIIHEVGNPIAAISGSVEILLRQQKKSLENADATYSAEDVIKGLEDVRSHISRLITITRNISSLSATRNDSVELTVINDLVSNIVNLMHYDERFGSIEFELHLDTTIPVISVNPDQLTQVVMNLLINAADACNEVDRDGSIIKLTTCTQENWLILIIEDNGSGMDNETLDHLFDEFYTTKPDGHGIGLPLCQSIINEHGGELIVESVNNSGSKIIIKLPIESAEG